ncbi:hypothetical protein [uncultured Draconibacterium sp.]|uniref:hypothetical protein n=1 Tax=uncultured Draconibacterium sp. TaxID=1573823 RepID=UPI003217A82E
MQEEKKQLEILLMDYFRSCYPEFPTGSAVPSESPDFIVKMKNKHLLGIELTRLNPASATIPDEEQREEIGFRNGLILAAKELFEHHSKVKLFVKFMFSEHKKISPEREIAVIAQVSALMRNKLTGKKENSFYKIVIPKNELPDGLNGILMVHHPKLETAIWERANNLGISNDVVDDIRQSIYKKDEKLSLYQKQHLNYYWLLITTDRLRGVKRFNLSNKILHENFQSRFQHVFLLDLMKSKVLQLV